MSGAGMSAQSKYERGRAKHRSGRRKRVAVNLAVALPIALLALVWTASVGYDFGPILAGMIMFIAFAKAWVEPAHVRAWGIGARGETITESELEQLPDGFELLHDRRLPGARGNVDHVVIGPGGVFVVESKRMTGKLSIRGDAVYVRGRNTHIVDQVLHQAEVLEDVLRGAGIEDVPIRPILYVQKADATLLVGRPLGVPIVQSGRGLRRQVTGVGAELGADGVARVTEVLDRALRPMQREPGPRLPVRPVEKPAEPEPVLAACPRCGNEMVLRRNKQGQSFLGCSQFPSCRGTRPWREA